MPDPITVHFRGDALGQNACGATMWEGERSWNPDDVTCPACKRLADPAPTLVHFTSPVLLPVGRSACGLDHRTNQVDSRPGHVTCFACRQSEAFKQASVIHPIKLSGVMAAAPEIQALDRAALREIAKRGLNAGRGDAEWEALVEIGQALGLTYDDETNRYS